MIFLNKTRKYDKYLTSCDISLVATNFVVIVFSRLCLRILLLEFEITNLMNGIGIFWLIKVILLYITQITKSIIC